MRWKAFGTEAELLLLLGQRGERVDGQEKLAGFLVGHVEHFGIHFHVGIDFAAEMAVDELEPAVGQFVGEQAAGEMPARKQ